jgi:hypothetical protein
MHFVLSAKIVLFVHALQAGVAAAALITTN